MTVVDLESIAIDNAVDYVSAARNIKDEAKKAANVEERAQAAALHPWLCRIIALGWCEEGSEVARVEVCPTEAREAVVLREFWQRVCNPQGQVERLVTFNGLGFDLPVLMARSMLLGVKHPELNLDRYRSPHVDLMARLSWHDPKKSLSLKRYAERFGINTDDAFTGAMIPQLYADGDWLSIEKHCESDVTLTRKLAERLGIMRAPSFVGVA
jgi:predicted PolB exonuclease-like 3'-5' exonuclease